MSTALSAQNIFDSMDLLVEEEPVPEWTPKGADEPFVIRLKIMTAAEALEFTAESKKDSDKGKDLARILQICAVDGNNNPLFNKGQVDMLMKKSLPVLMRLQNKCLKMNGLAKDKEEAEQLAAERKNG
jgi:hypothetical protein